MSSGGVDKTVKVWDAKTGKCQSTLRVDGLVSSLDFSPCGSKIAAAFNVLDDEDDFESGGVKIFGMVGSTGTFECESTLRGHSNDNPECKCTFEANGRLKKSNPQCPVEVDAGHYGVQSVSFSPKDNVIAAGCSNGKIYLVDALAGEVKSTLTGHSGR